MFAEKFITTPDHVKIAINHYSQNRKTVVVIAHGWYMCKDSNAFKNIAAEFFKHSDVITMDFRGHGRSSGRYTFTAKEPEDLKAVVDYAKQHYSTINLIGFSLGAALSIIHAAKFKDVNRLIAVSAPVSFEKIENHFWRKEAFIPTLQKFELFRWLSIRPGNIFLDKVRPIEEVDKINTPILFIAGEKDPTVYPWHCEALYEKANQPKALHIFKDNYHAEDLYLQSPERFMHTCVDWLAADERYNQSQT